MLDHGQMFNAVHFDQVKRTGGIGGDVLAVFSPTSVCHTKGEKMPRSVFTEPGKLGENTLSVVAGIPAIGALRDPVDHHRAE